MSNSLNKLVKDTIGRNHKDNFYRDIMDMVIIVEECIEDENVTDREILKAEVDGKSYDELTEMRRQNERYKRHGFERIKAIIKDYENVFKTD